MSEDSVKIEWIPVKSLRFMDDQRPINPEHVLVLAESMRSVGFKKEHFLLVTKLPEDHVNSNGTLYKKGELVVYDGRHRYYAAKKVLDLVAVHVENLTYEQAWLEGVKIGFDTKEYTFIEKARVVAVIKKQYNLDNVQVARKLNMTEGTVRYLLKILKAHPEIQGLIEKQELGASIGSIVSDLPEGLQAKMAKRIVNKPEIYTRDCVKDLVKSARNYPVQDSLDSFLNNMMDQLEGVSRDPENKDIIFAGKFDRNLEKVKKEKKVHNIVLSNKIKDVLKIEQRISVTLDEINSLMMQKESYIKNLPDSDFSGYKEFRQLKKQIQGNKDILVRMVRYYETNKK